MLDPCWLKVLRDLWSNRTRTILVVLSIAVGIFAVGTVTNSHLILGNDLAQSYAAINPASALLMTEPFDDELVETIRGMSEIQDAEGRRTIAARVQVGPQEWRDIQLLAIDNYDDIRINKVWPEYGDWPPPEHALLIERSGFALVETHVGDTVRIKVPRRKERDLLVAGLAHDLSKPPAIIEGAIYGYITFDTLEWLGEPRSFNELYIVVTDHPGDKAHIQKVADQVASRIERSHRAVEQKIVPEPGEHPLNYILETIMLLLSFIAVLSLMLSGFLVINIISALLTQHVRQIGILKAIGARTHQIMSMYFSMVLVFGLLALLIATPLGMVGARQFSQLMAGMLNFDIADFTLPSIVLLLELLAGLVVPLCAALLPIVSGTRITVREAIASQGTGASHFGQSMVDRLVERLRNLSRPLLLSLRNLLRRKGRLVLTLIPLTLGGAVFIAIVSLRVSLFTTLTTILDFYQHDVQITFDHPYRIERVFSAALAVPGVVDVEGWGSSTVRRVRPDDTESDNLLIMAPPPKTELLHPTMFAGRWLLPQDQNAVVISNPILRNEPDIAVGTEVRLKIDGRETTWRVVGIVQEARAAVFVNYPYYTTVARTSGQVSTLMIRTPRHDEATQAVTAELLEQHFEQLGLGVSSIVKIAEERAEAEAAFDVIVFLLLCMAVLLAAVGGLGLTGTMSINVLERTREIGVMRAIGASDSTVFQIVMVESVLISLVSWAISMVLAFPLGKLLSEAVGEEMLQMPLDYTFSLTGVLLWLGLVTVLAAIASYIPARKAARITVREALAHE